MKAAKPRYCFNCGEPLGCYADYDPLDTCGKRECDRAARDTEEDAIAQERANEEERRRYDEGGY